MKINTNVYPGLTVISQLCNDIVEVHGFWNAVELYFLHIPFTFVTLTHVVVERVLSAACTQTALKWELKICRHNGIGTPPKYDGPSYRRKSKYINKLVCPCVCVFVFDIYTHILSKHWINAAGVTSSLLVESKRLSIAQTAKEGVSPPLDGI